MNYKKLYEELLEKNKECTLIQSMNSMKEEYEKIEKLNIELKNELQDEMVRKIHFEENFVNNLTSLKTYIHYIENYSRIDDNCCCDTLEKYEINEENLKYLTVLIDDIFNMIRIPNWRNHFWLS